MTKTESWEMYRVALDTAEALGSLDMSDERIQKCIDTLRKLCERHDCLFEASNFDWSEHEGYSVVDSPPSDAKLCRHEDGHFCVFAEISNAYDVECAMHELAHLVCGMDREPPCYELEAVWALRFPPQVAARVWLMARETDYNETDHG